MDSSVHVVISIFSPILDPLLFGSPCLSNKENVEILSPFGQFIKGCKRYFYLYILNIYNLLRSSCRPSISYMFDAGVSPVLDKSFEFLEQIFIAKKELLN